MYKALSYASYRSNYCAEPKLGVYYFSSFLIGRRLTPSLSSLHCPMRPISLCVQRSERKMDSIECLPGQAHLISNLPFQSFKFTASPLHFTSLQRLFTFTSARSWRRRCLAGRVE